MGASRIAVVITCHDLGAYLPEAVASVRSQVRQPDELVIVDDGSTEAETLAVLARLEGEGVEVLRTSNRGLPAARNAGIRATASDLICSLDADDRLGPDWLAAAEEFLAEEPEMAFVSHWLEAFGDEQWQWRPQRCDLVALLDQNTVNGAALVRRGAIEACGLFDEEMRHGCEDWELWIRMCQRGHRGAILPGFHFQYRRRADSMSRTMRHDERLLQLVARHRDSYARHAVELLHRRESGARERLFHIDRLERRYHGYLRDEVARRERRVAELEAERAAILASWSWRLTAPLRFVAAPLMAAMRRAQSSAPAAPGRVELGALRASWSWRVTAPLRAAATLLLGGRRS